MVSPFDVVIVGAGMAGLWLATALNERVPRARIALCEIGVETPPDVAAARRTARDLPYRPMWLSHSDAFVGAHSGLKCVVGGRSLCWDGVAFRLQPHVLRSEVWPPDVVSDISTRYYRAIEDVVKIRTRCSSSALKFAGRSLGLDLEPIPRALLTDGQPYAPAGLGSGPPNVTLMAGRQVAGIIPARKGLVRVAFEGSDEVVVGRHIVICAGAIQNAGLLGRLMLEQSGEKELFMPGLGDHAVLGMATMRPIGDVRSLEGLDSYIPSISDAYELVQHSARKGGNSLIDWWIMGDLSPTSSRGVLVTRSGSKGFTATVNFLLNADDEAMLAQMHQTLRDRSMALQDFMRCPPMRRVSDVWALDHFVDAEFTPHEWRPYFCPPGTVHHEYGTTPLAGVYVDDDGTCRSLPAVSVLGGSLLPRLGAYNPSLTILALASRESDRLIARLGG